MANSGLNRFLGNLDFMMPLTVGFDRIRLLRRKILINRQEIAVQSVGKARDAAVLHAAALTEELLTALQDFADAGHEQYIADLIESLSE